MVCPLLSNHTVFTSLNVVFSHLVLRDILPHIPDYQSKPDVLKDMGSDRVCGAFFSEVRHECMAFGMTIVIFVM